jgi:hypothetical protein
MGIQKVWAIVCDISRAHYLIGLADPTSSGAVSAALNDIAKIDPPRSWPKDHKFRFTQLPYDLQVYVAVRERERDITVRRAQTETTNARNELAVVCSELAALQKKAKATAKAKEKAA